MDALASIVESASGERIHQVVADDGSQQRKPDLRNALGDAKALVSVLAMETEAVLGRRVARAVAVLVLFAVVVVVLFLVLHGYINPHKPGERKDLILALAQILAGAAILSGLYFTWRSLQVNREGQITERFTRAIDQLGSNELEIRLGGIYALERIARDSGRDHWPIMEVLTAYIRQHAKKSEEDSRAEHDPFEAQRPLDPDIQSIMTVLGRRSRSLSHGEPEPIDLRETNLMGAHLMGTDLRGANLTGANLTGANLTGANLVGANLRRANLTGADLIGADLTKADLARANLIGAHLIEANLVGANLRRANLTGADLWRANLMGADLWRANLDDAQLGSANLTEANLTEANLRGAYLVSANLMDAVLTQDQLVGATGDETTHLSPRLEPPSHWRRED